MKNLLTKSVLIAIAYYLFVIVNSCCNCKDIKPRDIYIASIHARNVSYAFEAATQRYSYQPLVNDSCTIERYGIEVTTDYQTAGNLKNDANPFVNTAYACKCAIDDQLSDTLKSITVITIQDFDGGHPAGSDVSELFDIPLYNSLKNKVETLPIPDYLAQLSSSSTANPLYLHLKKAPENQRVQFEMVYQLSNNKIVRDTTKLATLY